MHLNVKGVKWIRNAKIYQHSLGWITCTCMLNMYLWEIHVRKSIIIHYTYMCSTALGLINLPKELQMLTQKLTLSTKIQELSIWFDTWTTLYKFCNIWACTTICFVIPKHQSCQTLLIAEGYQLV